MKTVQKWKLQIAGYVTKKLIKQSKSESCTYYLLNGGDADIANDAYLNILSRGGLFVPSKSLADFLYSNFAIQDFVEIDVVALFLPVKTSETYVLRRYGPESDFTCANLLDWGFNFPTKIITNTFLTTNRDFQEILSERKVLLVLRNVKE